MVSETNSKFPQWRMDYNLIHLFTTADIYPTWPWLVNIQDITLKCFFRMARFDVWKMTAIWIPKSFPTIYPPYLSCGLMDNIDWVSLETVVYQLIIFLSFSVYFFWFFTIVKNFSDWFFLTSTIFHQSLIVVSIPEQLEKDRKQDAFERSRMKITAIMY